MPGKLVAVTKDRGEWVIVCTGLYHRPTIKRAEAILKGHSHEEQDNLHVVSQADALEDFGITRERLQRYWEILRWVHQQGGRE